MVRCAAMKQARSTKRLARWARGLRAPLLAGLAVVAAIPLLDSWGGRSLAQPGSPGSGPIDAITRPRHDLELAFTTAGRVAERLVEPGQRVPAGAPLLKLDDSEQSANLELLRVRAQSDIEVNNAEADLRMAQSEEARIRDAHSRDAAAAFEVERAELETLQASLRFELSKQRQLEAQLTLAQAQRRYEALTLSAPIAGVVEQVLVEPGETVEALRPVLRLVATDPLLVEAPAPTAQTLALTPGDSAWVRWRLPGEPRVVEGRIAHIAAVADPASDTRLVRIEAPNPFGLPAGSQVEVWLSRPPADISEPRASAPTPDANQGPEGGS